MFRRLAIANGHGWNHFVHIIEVLPRRGDTFLPFWVIIAGIVRNFYDRVYG
jgi:hypothetical protein